MTYERRIGLLLNTDIFNQSLALKVVQTNQLIRQAMSAKRLILQPERFHIMCHPRVGS